MDEGGSRLRAKSGWRVGVWVEDPPKVGKVGAGEGMESMEWLHNMLCIVLQDSRGGGGKGKVQLPRSQRPPGPRALARTETHEVALGLSRPHDREINPMVGLGGRGEGEGRRRTKTWALSRIGARLILAAPLAVSNPRPPRCGDAVE